jgi:cold shock CspA family protein
MVETPQRGKTRGVVTNVINDGQYAFCNPRGGGGKHFIHSSEMPSGLILKEGQVLEYTLIRTPKGYQGKEVKVLLEK